MVARYTDSEDFSNVIVLLFVLQIWLGTLAYEAEYRSQMLREEIPHKRAGENLHHAVGEPVLFTNQNGGKRPFNNRLEPTLQEPSSRDALVHARDMTHRVKRRKAFGTDDGSQAFLVGSARNEYASHPEHPL